MGRAHSEQGGGTVTTMNAPALMPYDDVIANFDPVMGLEVHVELNTRTKMFVDQVKGRPVYLGISGRTLEFDGSGTCMAGGCY